MAAHEHVGVYGAWLQDGRLVTVEKSRGPYTGWLDLPGGTPEPGESELDTLLRELTEECGVTVAAVLAWSDFDVPVDRASDGTTIDFRHRGRIALVSADGPVTPVEGVEDVARVVLLAPGDPRPVTPAVSLAWRSLAQQR
ncbi:NUDIX domain-containing protein [Curtobacterium luteum]|uniref:NUDIX domain-containing protein n=1 Tax=Curtobacterium luteum TaxID=33881 RepID=UPI0007379BDA|nr:NUDIX domain-containing protein [Curtobacterium luteum]